MTRTAAVNGGALALALLAGLGAGLDRAPRDARTVEVGALTISSVRRVRLPAGGEGIADASGRVIPLRPYRRIVSTSLLTDRLLLDLAEPARVLAFSSASLRGSPWRWRFAGKPAVEGLGPLEPIVALKPDLVLMNSFGGSGRADKLRAAGMEVFDLGELRGLRTLLPMAEIVGELLGEPARGRRYADSFRQRLQRVAAPLGARPRRKALYLAVIAGNVYGGTRGTSYHDVLVHAGLEDVAAAHFSDWPQYSSEQIAALDPELVVTKEDLATAVCAHPGLERLRVCRDPGRILTVPAGLIDEPGVAMLDAAELLFAAAYPDLSPAVVPTFAPPPARP